MHPWVKLADLRVPDETRQVQTRQVQHRVLGEVREHVVNVVEPVYCRAVLT